MVIAGCVVGGLPVDNAVAVVGANGEPPVVAIGFEISLVPPPKRGSVIVIVPAISKA